jgi:transcription elongation factor Elf1
MDLRTRSIDRFACSRPVIECAQCGEPIYLSEWLEYLDSHRARHLWHCDACGVSFETTVRIAAA